MKILVCNAGSSSFNFYFSRFEPSVFTPLRGALLTHGDYFMHLADLKSYLEADQRLRDLYAEPGVWTRKAILNVAASGKFSSDRTIAEYAAVIWKVGPCPVLEEWSRAKKNKEKVAIWKYRNLPASLPIRRC